MIILDTSILSYLDRGLRAIPSALRDRLQTVEPEEVATTIICFEEQMRGWLSYISASRNVSREIDGYRRLRDLLHAYSSRNVLLFDQPCAAEFERLRATKLRVGTMDLKIAAIAIHHDALLVTENVHDFARVPGLRTEDWTR